MDACYPDHYGAPCGISHVLTFYPEVDVTPDLLWSLNNAQTVRCGTYFAPLGRRFGYFSYSRCGGTGGSVYTVSGKDNACKMAKNVA